MRIEFEEGAIAFIGLGHYIGTVAIACVAAKACYLAANNNGGVNAAFGGNAGNHSAGSGFAMRASHCHAQIIIQ